LYGHVHSNELFVSYSSLQEFHPTDDKYGKGEWCGGSKMMFLSFIFLFCFVFSFGKSIEIRYSSMLEVGMKNRFDTMQCNAMQCNAMVMAMEDGRWKMGDGR
jgi:hypothetical protein